MGPRSPGPRVPGSPVPGSPGPRVPGSPVPGSPVPWDICPAPRPSNSRRKKKGLNFVLGGMSLPKGKFPGIF